MKQTIKYAKSRVASHPLNRIFTFEHNSLNILGRSTVRAAVTVGKR